MQYTLFVLIIRSSPSIVPAQAQDRQHTKQ